MTPAARISAAIDVLDRILAGEPAEAALIRWARASRFAGSGDRAAVRDLVFDSLRRLRSRAALGGALSGRGLMIGMCRESGTDPATVFSGARFAPAPLVAGEGTPQLMTRTEALDLPDWLAPQMQSDLGRDFVPVAQALRERAPVWLRANPVRADVDTLRAELAKQGIETDPHPDLPTALRVREGARRLSGTDAYRGGWFELQDLSSQRAAAALPLAAGDRVLDYCAGGGGKVLALASRVPAKFFAHDISAERMRDLPVRAARAGADIALVPPGEVRGSFDLVLVDAPCSGSGTWRRTPEEKWRLTPERLAELTGIQRDILRAAVPMVRAGGHLAYMTCSVLDAENAAQSDWFTAACTDFFLHARHRFLPDQGGDGFFLALFRKAG